MWVHVWLFIMIFIRTGSLWIQACTVFPTTGCFHLRWTWLPTTRTGTCTSNICPLLPLLEAWQSATAATVAWVLSRNVKSQLCERMVHFSMATLPLLLPGGGPFFFFCFFFMWGLPKLCCPCCPEVALLLGDLDPFESMRKGPNPLCMAWWWCSCGLIRCWWTASKRMTLPDGGGDTDAPLVLHVTTGKTKR